MTSQLAIWSAPCDRCGGKHEELYKLSKGYYVEHESRRDMLQWRVSSNLITLCEQCFIMDSLSKDYKP